MCNAYESASLIIANLSAYKNILSQKRTIVNEWEKFNRISNRRLSVQGTTTPLKLNWSIDRITIVGRLKENIYYHTSNDVLILDFAERKRWKKF
ncbi:hypothetical protein IGI96_003928 [Enterococcus sp. DIV0421]